MLVGAADIFANHPFLVIGSAGTPDLEEVDWDDESPAWTNGEHLLIGTFGRAGLVRVTIWESAMPLIGEVVFDGQLEVAGSQLSIGDLEELTRLTMQVGESGPQRIVVCADDPGYASRVSIGFDLGEQVATLTSVAGHPLPPVLLSAKGEMSWSEEFGLILDGHDAPRARLAAAIKLMPVPGPAVEPEEEEADEDDLADEAVAPDGTYGVVTTSGTGDVVTTSGTGDVVTTSGTGDVVTSSGTVEIVTSSGANEVVTASGTGEVVTASGTGEVVTASGTGEVVTASGTGEVVTASGTEEFVAASDTDEEEVEEDTSVDVSRLVEWLRGLGGGIRLADAEACGEMIADRMRAAGTEGAGLPDEVALAIATDVMERLELR